MLAVVVVAMSVVGALFDLLVVMKNQRVRYDTEIGDLDAHVRGQY